VNGLHDLGGLGGLGPVVVEEDEPVFHARWEARTLGMMLALAGSGHYNADTFRAARETIPAPRYLTSRYYELWLFAVEQLMRDAVTPAELEAAVERLRRGELSVPDRRDPQLAARLRQGLRAGHSTAGTAAAPHRYAVGDRVRARNLQPAGHTRLPAYARGRVGTIERRYPAFPIPDRNAYGDPTPENLYCVRFDAHELWGPDGDANGDLMVDLWESYLEDVDDPSVRGGSRTKEAA
jgi:nitrile hydratase subunit beta